MASLRRKLARMAARRPPILTAPPEWDDYTPGEKAEMKACDEQAEHDWALADGRPCPVADCFWCARPSTDIHT